MPAGKLVHVILDNYATHKHAKVPRWLGRHPRFVFHFTPTSCSWLNAVETFFAQLTRRRLKRGVFHSIVDLQAAINRLRSSTETRTRSPSSGRPIPTSIVAKSPRSRASARNRRSEVENRISQNTSDSSALMQT